MITNVLLNYDASASYLYTYQLFAYHIQINVKCQINDTVETFC